MYLDTKNLTASSNNNTTAATKTVLMAPKAGRRMRKVWQPLRRLLTVGGKGRPMSQPHPNNVDLNNTQLLLLPPLELLSDSKATSTIITTPDESINKFAAELSQQQVPEEDLTQTPPPPNTPTLISSVYVEKVSTQSCNACQHGRNCQHTHRSSNSNSNSNSNINLNANSNAVQSTSTPTTTPTPTPTLWDLQLPLQYISTDNGTFFWANTQERVDDDLLHAWLCQSFSQLPGTLC
ncbi:enhancer of split M2 protein [Drosophila grimshawi]|uniref:GH18147 n=1 Tax=Drosophila grimshawi TaxID=7222 RepID=B4JGI5_DROGR|nr:enhancer of split M2 protein [Drosophila grimshawi]EDV93682.1 GH18147 [Drosophila grimshawi]